jgi:hypothetical protein
MFPTRTTVVGKKRFRGVTLKEVLLLAAAGRNAQLDGRVFSGLSAPAPVRLIGTR